MNFDYDLLVKLAMACIGLVGAAKGIYEWSIGRRSKLREEYKFAKDFIDAVNGPVAMHPYLKEKGYQAIAGDTTISGAEVEYLLSLTRPQRALSDYVMGREYLEHLPDSGNLQLKFKKKYERKWSRQWRTWTYSALYFVFSFTAFSPLIFSSYLHLSAQQTFTAFAIGFFTLVPYGLLFLRSSAKISRAENLVANQNRHTQRILISSLPAKRKIGE